MISSYVEYNRRKWDQHLSEFRFALNSSVYETTRLTPAELHLWQKLSSPMDNLLQETDLLPDSLCYDVMHHIKDLQQKAGVSSKQAKYRQLRNYIKGRRVATCRPKDRVWLE